MTVECCFLACTAYISHVCVSNQRAEVSTVCVVVGGETLSLMFLGSFFVGFFFFLVGWLVGFTSQRVLRVFCEGEGSVLTPKCDLFNL